MCMYVLICEGMHLHAYGDVHVHMCIYIYTHTYSHIYIYTYTYLYRHVHTHTHTRAYTYTLILGAGDRVILLHPPLSCPPSFLPPSFASSPSLSPLSTHVGNFRRVIFCLQVLRRALLLNKLISSLASKSEMRSSSRISR